MALYPIGLIPIDGTDPIEFIDGWHVNSDTMIPELHPFVVVPATPYRVFMGVTTYSYRFDSEAHWLAVAAEHNLLPEVE